MADYPERNLSVCEFFASIGIDPNLVLEEGINEAGYRKMRLTVDGRRRWDELTDSVMAEFTPWPNGLEDFHKYRRARNEDWDRMHP